jgi:excisionase family DNA binding protein
MQVRNLYSIEEARELLGGVSRNSIYRVLNSGDLPSVVIGCRRFISADAIEEFIASATTRVGPAIAAVRLRNLRKKVATVPPPTPVQRRAANRGPLAILPSLAHQSRKTREPT